MYFVYIIFSEKLNKFYTGLSQNVGKRLSQHNCGNVPFTSKGFPWELVYYEGFIHKQDAIDEEKFLKSGRGRERRSHILKNYLESLKRRVV